MMHHQNLVIDCWTPVVSVGFISYLGVQFGLTWPLQIWGPIHDSLFTVVNCCKHSGLHLQSLFGSIFHSPTWPLHEGARLPSLPPLFLVSDPPPGSRQLLKTFFSGQNPIFQVQPVGWFGIETFFFTPFIFYPSISGDLYSFFFNSFPS